MGAGEDESAASGLEVLGVSVEPEGLNTMGAREMEEEVEEGSRRLA